MRDGVKAVWIAAVVGTAFVPAIACAQDATASRTQDSAVPDAGVPEAEAPPTQDAEPVIPEAEFEAALPELSGDIEAPLEPMQNFATAPADGAAGEQLAEPLEPTPPGVLPPAAVDDPELTEPLAPVATFDAEPPPAIEGVDDDEEVVVRYSTEVEGLDAVGLEGRFRDLSALEEGDGEAANATMIAARAREDEALAVRLLQSLGYYDGSAVSTVEQNPANSGRFRVTLNVEPGERYTFSSIAIDSAPTVPPDLIDEALPLNVGDPIEAERVQGAEANVSLRLPQQGYPFIQLRERDILLDGETTTGAYTLPVDLGPRASFGGYTTEPASDSSELAFDAEHVGVLARFERGQLYDSRLVDDLREALIATSLFSPVSVEPVRTGETAPDGTEYVNLRVRQQAGPPRTLAGEAGYSTGQGLRVEGSWTHRNLFPPEGALIASAVGGTQEQGLGVTFRRSNAGRRDRTVSLSASVNHSDYEAFESFTGTLAGRISYDSTPIWQKRWTYYYGFELVGSNEDRYNFDAGKRDRGTWLIAALPAFLGYDTSDDLLNPTSGFRI